MGKDFLVAALEPLRGTHPSGTRPTLVDRTLRSGSPVTRHQPLAIADRALQVTEAQPHAGSPVQAAGVLPPSPQETAAPWSDSGAPSRVATRRLAPLVLGGSSGLILAGLVAIVVATRTQATPAAPATVVVGAVPPTPSTPPDVSPAAPPTGAPTAPLASAPAPSVTSPAVPDSASPSHVSPGSTTRGPVKAKAACDPPYVYDAKGTRHYKPECL